MAAAITKPAPRPTSVRAVQQEELVEEEQEEVLDDTPIDDSLDGELDNDLKRLLASD